MFAFLPVVGQANERWVGSPVMNTLSINEEQAAAMVSTWLKSGLLRQEMYHDVEQRRERTGIFIDDYEASP